jgi:hypothetical protein
MAALEHVRAYEALAKHEKLTDLVALTRLLIDPAVRARTTMWADKEALKTKCEELGLDREAAKTDFGNALEMLESGPDDDAGRALACALYARSIADAPPKDAEGWDRLAGDVLWLAAHTPFDALPLIDRALAEGAGEAWLAIADRVRKVDARRLPIERAEGLLGAAALAASPSKAAVKQAAALSRELEDAALVRILRGVERDDRGEEKLSGELFPTPRGPVATAALAFTGLLFVIHAARLLARLALAYRRPTEVTLDGDGVRVRAKTIVLGRTLRDSETVIARAGLVHATREVRYPRLAFYAGLLAMALGSYLGVRTLVDGARSASPSLLLAGLVFVAIGIGLDFALTSVAPGTSGRCRVLFVPKAGRVVCIGNVDAKRADAALARLASTKSL